MISIPQRTIIRSVTCSGIGIHTGSPATVVCRPAPVGTGIVFVRTDQRAEPEVKAALEMVSGTQRGITLAGRAPVRTVEHLLAAAAGVGVSNLRVEVRGEELPILDGSAAPYVEALTSAGIIEQEGRRPVRTLHSPLWVSQDAAWILAVPADHLRITYIVPLPATNLGTQVVDFEADARRFAEEIAPSRTWGFAPELQALQQAGLARGASPVNALGIGAEGYLSPPRFPDEPARHKVLDLLGDLMLAETALRAHIIACGAGHALHVELARRIVEIARLH